MTITIPNDTGGVLPGNIGQQSELLTPNVGDTGTASEITLTGDVNGIGTNTIETAIQPASVTYAKIQNVAPLSLFGNPTNTAAPGSEIPLGSGVAFFNNALSVSVAGGWINKFRNGGFSVAQRGTSGSLFSAGTSLDGWILFTTGTSVPWSQQYSSSMSINTLRLTCASGLTGCSLVQRIESVMAAQLLQYNKVAQPVTIQYAIFNGTSAAITPILSIAYANSADNFGAVTSDLGSTPLQSIAAGATGIVSYTYTPTVNISKGIQVVLAFGGALNSASGYVEIGYADIRSTPGVLVGLNNNPPSPEIRTPATELLLCNRYYWDPGAGGSAASFNVGGYAAASTSFNTAQITFPTAMRANPTVTPRNQSYSNASGLVITVFGASSAATSITATGTGNAACSFNITASAEL